MISESIQRIGIRRALIMLAPYARQAGQVALRLQPQVKGLVLEQKKGHRFTSAVTDVDYLVEDRLGSDVLTLFDDAAFFGEERDTDRISRFVNYDQPYIVTCDPVNGTLYYRDGLPIFEVILTICNREWEMLGALVYAPATDKLFIGYEDRVKGPTGAQWFRFYDDGQGNGQDTFFTDTLLLRGHTPNGQREIHLSEDFADQVEPLREAGYKPLFPHRDYKGESDWPYCTSRILFSDNCDGIIRRPGQLIDNGAIGFILKQAGGFWSHGPLDRVTMHYSYSVMSRDEETHKRLMKLVG